MRYAIERQQTAHGVGSGVEVRAPDPLAHDGDARVGPFVRALERVAEDRMRAQDAKVVGAHRHRPDALRLSAIREVGPLDAVRVQHGHFQRPAVIAVVGRCQTRQIAIVVSTAVIDAHEAFRILVREWLEDDAIQDAEDGGVGTDAERQRDYHHSSESGARRYRAHRVLEVEEHAVHMWLRRRSVRKGWARSTKRNQHSTLRGVTPSKSLQSRLNAVRLLAMVGLYGVVAYMVTR